MMESNEQWIKGGNCNLCRRRNYCKKMCKQHSLMLDRKLSEAIEKTPFGQVLNNISNDLYRT